MIRTPSDLRKKLIELVANGWVPISSGDGKYLYLKKGNDYSSHGIPGEMLIGACGLIDRLFFEEVDEYKKMMYSK